MGEKYYQHKRLACRNDYCTNCHRVTFTERYRYLVVLTKFTIPIIPIGYQTSWICSQCGKSPEGAAPTNKTGLLVGLFVGVILSGYVFTSPFDDLEEGQKWGLRIMLMIFTLVLCYKYFFEDRRGYEQKRNEVTPLSKENCPYCKKALEHRARAKCPACNVEVC